MDACKDVEAFKHDLFIFMKQRGTPIVYVPKVGYTRGMQNSLLATVFTFDLCEVTFLSLFLMNLTQ